MAGSTQGGGERVTRATIAIRERINESIAYIQHEKQTGTNPRFGNQSTAKYPLDVSKRYRNYYASFNRSLSPRNAFCDRRSLLERLSKKKDLPGIYTCVAKQVLHNISS